MSDATMVTCPECGHLGRVVDCLMFACAGCGLIAVTADRAITYDPSVPKVGVTDGFVNA